LIGKNEKSLIQLVVVGRHPVLFKVLSNENYPGEKVVHINR
jgi:hypothetical protein